MAETHVLVSLLVPVPDGLTPDEVVREVNEGFECRARAETVIKGPLDGLSDVQRLRGLVADHGFALRRDIARRIHAGDDPPQPRSGAAARPTGRRA